MTVPSAFAQRLDFLMSLTGTTNSALARKLAFDASYISRIRAGKRGVPLHQPFIEPAAHYLAGKITDPYQIQAIERAVGLTENWPDNPNIAASLIAEWLKDQNLESRAGFQQILDRFASPAIHPHEPAPIDTRGKTALPEAPVSSLHFIGNAGKRKAVEAFLATLVARDEPAELLLYSDECMDWLIEDSAFTARWQQLLLALVAKGSRICVLHTLSRDIGEMVHAVHDWLPLYLTGNVRSLYCPRIRDGICRRTLFVAVNSMAITSSSIGRNVDGMVNVLCADPGAVRAYEREFRNLEALCKPLVRVARLDDGAEIADMLSSFADASSVVVRDDADAPANIPEKSFPKGPARKALDAILKNAVVRRSPQLPENVAAIVSQDGFMLVGLGESRVALAVTERLLTASFAEYLGD